MICCNFYEEAIVINSNVSNCSKNTKYVSIIINDEILQKLRILLIQIYLFHLPLLILLQ